MKQSKISLATYKAAITNNLPNLLNSMNKISRWRRFYCKYLKRRHKIKMIPYVFDRIEETLKNDQWNDDLLWCPSQCYLGFTYRDKFFILYLRWRWDDPWTADLVEMLEESNEITDGNWFTLDIGYFKDTELEQCKAAAIKAAEEYLHYHF